MIYALNNNRNNNNNIAFFGYRLCIQPAKKLEKRLLAPIQPSPLPFFASILGFQCGHGSNRPLFRSSCPPHGLLKSFLLLGFVVWILRKLFFWGGLPIKPVDDAQESACAEGRKGIGNGDMHGESFVQKENKSSRKRTRKLKKESKAKQKWAKQKKKQTNKQTNKHCFGFQG